MQPQRMPAINAVSSARFWSKVNVLESGDCWLWKGATAHGYGRFRLNPKVVAYAHRVAYQLLIGQSPHGLGQLDHLCRNRLCCNPYHLEIVTSQVNTLRGVGQGAQNAKKTHCPQGHPLTGLNLYLKPRKNGRFARVCLMCRRAHQKVLSAKHRSPDYIPSTKSVIN